MDRQLQILEETARKILSEVYNPQRAEVILAPSRSLPDPARYKILDKLIQDASDLQPGAVKATFPRLEHAYGRLVEKPVDPVTFLLDPYFANGKTNVWPKLVPVFEEMNSGRFDEVVMTGAIGVGKTTLVVYSMAYQLYLFSLYTRPQESFGLDHISEILFIFQSINLKLAKEVGYERFRQLISSSPYFNEKFAPNPEITSEMRFPRRLIVRPVAGTGESVLGQNVFGAAIDEMNFMARVQESKMSVEGKEYDQAMALYNAIATRRENRRAYGHLLRQDQTPGLLFLISSKRYPGQFTDKKEVERNKQLELTGKTSIYLYDKRPWDVAPEGTFEDEWFDVFIGDLTRKPKILKEEDAVSVQDRHLVVSVPTYYRNAFERDIMGSLRDIAAVSTLARYPFFTKVESVAGCFGKVPSILSASEVDFDTLQLAILPGLFRDVDQPRYAHVDLAVSADCAGVAMGYVKNFVSVNRDGYIEVMPYIVYDFLLSVRPPPGGEIEFARIRRLLYKVRDLGLPLRWVSFDSFQSRDSMQVLAKEGFQTGLVSLDVDSLGYDWLKTALYDGRVAAPTHEKCQFELISLEKDAETGKIDHPPDGSKDVSDAMAGVCFGLSVRREIWAMHDVSTYKIPESMRAAAGKKSAQMTTRRLGSQEDIREA